MGNALRLTATCGLGLEELLADELGRLTNRPLERQRGAVGFEGTWPDVWRANWRLRVANRVLVELGTWKAETGEELARGAAELVRRQDLSWDGLRCAELFDPSRTLALRSTASASTVTDTRWINVSVKDGLVDAQRQIHGRRSSVDRKRPDLPLRVWLQRNRATLLLDTSGEPLDRRGYRVESTTAPLRENLAAACVLASKWGGAGPVVDPMCGSGTLLAEAASVALARPAGLHRRGWAFERLPGFEASAWDAIRAEPRTAIGPEVELYGADVDPQALEAARKNLRAAALARRTTLTHGDAWEIEPPREPGLLLINPPYGARLESPRDQWRGLGDLMKQRYKGWRAVVLAGDPDRGKHIGLRPSRRLPVRNGPLDARILVFDLY